MKLGKLKEKVIEKIGETYADDFDVLEQDVYLCKNGWDLLKVLKKYGKDTQESLDILFNILIERN